MDKENNFEAEVGFGLPKIETLEIEDEVVVRVFISGIDEKDVKLEVKDDFLKILIKKDSCEEEEEGNVNYSEWKKYSFSGKVSLPCAIVPTLPEYSYDGKVLEIRMIRNEEGK